MNIHLPAILGFTRYQGFDPSPFVEMLKSNMVKFASPGHHTMLCQQIFEQLSGPFHLPEKLPQRECSGCSVAWDMLGYSFFMSLSFFLGDRLGGSDCQRNIASDTDTSQNVLRSLIFDTPRRHRFDQVEIHIFIKFSPCAENLAHLAPDNSSQPLTTAKNELLYDFP